VVIGFRLDSSASVYFDSDPVYQFNTTGELRRAFVDGLMIKAVDGRLASPTRHRTADEAQLVRHDLSATETQTLLSAMQQRLDALRDALRQQHYRLVGQVPTEIDVVGRCKSWLEGRPATTIAHGPRVG
jgi:hypothetical protein